MHVNSCNCAPGAVTVGGRFQPILMHFLGVSNVFSPVWSVCYQQNTKKFENRVLGTTRAQPFQKGSCNCAPRALTVGGPFQSNFRDF